MGTTLPYLVRWFIHGLFTRDSGLVRTIGIFWSFELDFESLHSYLEPVHSLYRCLSTSWIVKWHKSCKRMLFKAILLLDIISYNKHCKYLIFLSFIGLHNIVITKPRVRWKIKWGQALSKLGRDSSAIYDNQKIDIKVDSMLSRQNSRSFRKFHTFPTEMYIILN